MDTESSLQQYRTVLANLMNAPLPINADEDRALLGMLEQKMKPKVEGVPVEGDPPAPAPALPKTVLEALFSRHEKPIELAVAVLDANSDAVGEAVYAVDRAERRADQLKADAEAEGLRLIRRAKIDLANAKRVFEADLQCARALGLPSWRVSTVTPVSTS